MSHFKFVALFFVVCLWGKAAKHNLRTTSGNVAGYHEKKLEWHQERKWVLTWFLHNTLQWTDVLSRMNLYLLSSVPQISSGATSTLNWIKQLPVLKIYRQLWVILFWSQDSYSHYAHSKHALNTMIAFYSFIIMIYNPTIRGQIDYRRYLHNKFSNWQDLKCQRKVGTELFTEVDLQQ